MNTDNSNEQNISDITSGLGAFIRGIWVLGLVAGLGFILIFNPITQGVWAGMSYSIEFNDRSAKAFEERNFRETCPEYRDASLYDRWFTSRISVISWCDDYIDRL